MQCSWTIHHWKNSWWTIKIRLKELFYSKKNKSNQQMQIMDTICHIHLKILPFSVKNEIRLRKSVEIYVFVQ